MKNIIILIIMLSAAYEGSAQRKMFGDAAYNVNGKWFYWINGTDTILKIKGDSVVFYKPSNIEGSGGTSTDSVNVLIDTALAKYVRDSSGFVGGSIVSSLTATNRDSLHLVGDVVAPGNFYYYGTNGSGTKGLYLLSSVLPKAASFLQTGTATTTFTVTIGSTQPNNTYKVNVTPTSVLAAALFYVTNKTTTTFDVVYLAGLTGDVSFDYSLFN